MSLAPQTDKSILRFVLPELHALRDREDNLRLRIARKVRRWEACAPHKPWITSKVHRAAFSRPLSPSIVPTNTRFFPICAINTLHHFACVVREWYVSSVLRIWRQWQALQTTCYVPAARLMV